MGDVLVTTVIAVTAALLAAFCFAVAALAQQTVARATGADEAMHPRLLLDLARRPRWLAGIGLDALSFFILALALAFGPLALVQPIASLDVLFRAAAHRPPAGAPAHPAGSGRRGHGGRRDRHLPGRGPAQRRGEDAQPG